MFTQDRILHFRYRKKHLCIIANTLPKHFPISRKYRRANDVCYCRNVGSSLDNCDVFLISRIPAPDRLALRVVFIETLSATWVANKDFGELELRTSPNFRTSFFVEIANFTELPNFFQQFSPPLLVPTFTKQTKPPLCK